MSSFPEKKVNISSQYITFSQISIPVHVSGSYAVGTSLLKYNATLFWMFQKSITFTVANGYINLAFLNFKNTEGTR